MIKSKVHTKEEVLAHLHSGMTMMVSDFLGLTGPDELMDAIAQSDLKDFTLIAITTGKPDEGCGKLVTAKKVKKAITTHIGTNKESVKQVNEGTMEVEFIPQGTFAEKVRCKASGLGGVLTPVGIGTLVEEGKRKITVEGREYLLETPLGAEVAILKANKADPLGNLVYNKTTAMDQTTMAMAADFVIAEVEELVEVGGIAPEDVDTPAPLVDMIYLRENKDKRPIPPSWKKLREGSDQ